MNKSLESMETNLVEPLSLNGEEVLQLMYKISKVLIKKIAIVSEWGIEFNSI